MDMSKFALAKKYQGLEKNVWVEFIQLALEYKPLNLGQGLPDDLVPEYVPKTLSEVTLEAINGPLNQYTRGFGHPRLIQALAGLYNKLLNRTIDPLKEVLVTDGAYEALFAAISGLVNPGDEVSDITEVFGCTGSVWGMAFLSVISRKSVTLAAFFNGKFQFGDCQNVGNFFPNNH